MPELADVKALTFDAFGTILDLRGSLLPYIAEFLKQKQALVSPEKIWDDWRARQRIEQFQDTIMMVGHSGYLETSRRACVYTLALNNISASADEVKGLMDAWQYLSPFAEVLPALQRLKGKYKLVVLSNGEPEYLEHLVNNRIQFNFDKVISVNVVGARACGFQAAFVNRNKLPYDDTPYKPQMTVNNFTELADLLL